MIVVLKVKKLFVLVLNSGGVVLGKFIVRVLKIVYVWFVIWVCVEGVLLNVLVLMFIV